jgi:fatty-acyl-CoA synthase
VLAEFATSTSLTTFYEVLRHRAEQAGRSPALEMMGSRDEAATYAELRERVDEVAAGLFALGLRRGCSIALWLPNSIEWVVLQFAAAKLGLLVIPLNTRYRSAELTHLLQVSDAAALVYTPRFNWIDFEAVVADVLAEFRAAGKADRLGVLITVDSAERAGAAPDGGGATVVSYSDLTRQGAGKECPTGGEAEDLAVVFGTSGTTSFPKLAGHNQRTIATHGANVARALEVSDRDAMLCDVPFCGTYGFVALMATLSAGARAVIMPVFKPEAAVQAIATHRATCLAATSAMLGSLLTAAADRPAALASLRRVAVAGTSVHAMVEGDGERLGISITNVYGSSEALALMSLWPSSEPASVRSTPGGRLVGPDMRVRAADPDTGAVLPEGEYGELHFSGYNVMQGYLQNPAANREAFTEDGWLRSEDRGRVLKGGGAFEYETRMSDTLRLRGFLTNPSEIEELLRTHPDVAAAEVVGTVDEGTGEDIAVAFVQSATGAILDEQELREYCLVSIANFKVPTRIVQLAEYPTIPSVNGEKVQKNRLREMAKEHLAVHKLGAEGE